MKQITLIVAIMSAARVDAGTVMVTHGDAPPGPETCTLAQAIYAANLANNPANATPPGASTIEPLAHSTTTTVGIGSCTGAIHGDNSIDLELIAGQTLVFDTTDNLWYGPNALPPIASTIVIEGRGAILEIPAGTLRRRFFFVGADAEGTRTPGYNTPGPGALTLHDLHLRGGRQLGGSSTYGGGGGGFGGAIYNQGSLHLQRTTFSDNRAAGGSIGGGNRIGGGGMGEDAPAGYDVGAGGMGGVVPVGSTQTGQNAQPFTGGAGGGPDSGFAGRGGDRASQDAAAPGSGGNGGGGGGPGVNGTLHSGGGGGGGFGGGNGGSNAQSANSGGGFGRGGRGIFNTATGAGGGGVGGGGGGNNMLAAQGRGGGGGGFGGGGGTGGNPAGGGDGGFGGGGAAGYFSALGPPGRGGFAGGRAGDGLAFQGGGGGGGGLGGAIFNHFGVVTMTNVTFTSNAATAGTGGAGSTSARGLGGAVFNLNGDISVADATFSDNNADAGGALYSLGYNGSLDAGSRHAQVTVVRSVLANNGPGGDIGNDVPSLTSGNPNLATEILTVNDSLVKDPSGALVPIGSSNNNLLEVDPLLGPLQDNGGLSQTQLPAPDSVVIDAIDCASPNPETDQRGIARPQGTRCDIGAVEAEVPGPSDVIFADGFED